MHIENANANANSEIIFHFYILGAWILSWFQATLLYYQLVEVIVTFVIYVAEPPNLMSFWEYSSSISH
jgi:hypothetical protein